MQPDSAAAPGGDRHVKEGGRREQAQKDALEGGWAILRKKNCDKKVESLLPHIIILHVLITTRVNSQDYYATILLMRKQQLERLRLQMEKDEEKEKAKKAATRELQQVEEKEEKEKKKKRKKSKERKKKRSDT